MKVDPTILEELAAGRRRGTDLDPQQRAALVAHLAAEGLSTGEIARRINLNERNVGRIRKRLGIAQPVGANQHSRATTRRER